VLPDIYKFFTLIEKNTEIFLWKLERHKNPIYQQDLI